MWSKAEDKDVTAHACEHAGHFVAERHELKLSTTLIQTLISRPEQK